MSIIDKLKSEKKYVLLLLVFLALIAYLSITLMPMIAELTSKPEKIRDFLKSFGNAGIFVFLLLQVLQVVIAAIPGDLLHVSGGFVYGALSGAALSYVGVMLGATLAFFMSRFFGYKLVKKFVAESQYEQFGRLLNTNKAGLGMFIICSIPGIPKDVLAYIAGLTPIGSLRFLSIYALARIPGIIISASIGANIYDRHYMDIVISGGIIVVLFIIGFFVRGKIIGGEAK